LLYFFYLLFFLSSAVDLLDLHSFPTRRSSDLPRKLRQFLKHLDKNHLAKVLLSRSTWSMRAHQFCHKRIKLPDQCASRFIIMLERSFNQRACVRIIHVIENASTPLPMTGSGGVRLQFLQLNRENKM